MIELLNNLFTDFIGLSGVDLVITLTLIPIAIFTLLKGVK